MRDLTEEPSDIEIHISFTRDELQALIDDLDYFSTIGQDFKKFLSEKLG
jgi:hypothetical protein